MSKLLWEFKTIYFGELKLLSLMFSCFCLEGVSVAIGKPVFCLALYLTGVHFWGELGHAGDVSEKKFKCRPIRTREIGGVRLSEALHVTCEKLFH